MHCNAFLDQVFAVKGQTDMADYVSLTDQRQMKVMFPQITTQKNIANTLNILISFIKGTSAVTRYNVRESQTRLCLSHKILQMSICILRGIGTASNGLV